MKSRHFLVIGLIAACASYFLVSCSKSESVGGSMTTNGRQNASLYLTDAPGFFDHVNLDIKTVSVLVDTSKNTRDHDNSNWDDLGSRDHRPDSFLVWEDLGVKAGIYDLIQLRNGVDTLLASANITAGSIRLIRIDLGTNNTLVKDSVSYPLNLVPGLPSYILIKLKGDEWEHFGANSTRLWLDFDVEKSIVQLRNNAFYLSPVIRAFVVTKTGQISGDLLPRDAWPEIVTVFNNTDTAYGLTNRDGAFRIRGLKDGNYSVFFNASNGYKDTTLSNVTINNAGSVSLGNITLHK